VQKVQTAFSAFRDAAAKIALAADLEAKTNVDVEQEAQGSAAAGLRDAAAMQGGAAAMQAQGGAAAVQPQGEWPSVWKVLEQTREQTQIVSASLSNLNDLARDNPSDYSVDIAETSVSRSLPNSGRMPMASRGMSSMVSLRNEAVAFSCIPGSSMASSSPRAAGSWTPATEPVPEPASFGSPTEWKPRRVQPKLQSDDAQEEMEDAAKNHKGVQCRNEDLEAVADVRRSGGGVPPWGRPKAFTEIRRSCAAGGEKLRVCGF